MHEIACTWVCSYGNDQSRLKNNHERVWNARTANRVNPVMVQDNQYHLDRILALLLVCRHCSRIVVILTPFLQIKYAFRAFKFCRNENSTDPWSPEHSEVAVPTLELFLGSEVGFCSVIEVLFRSCSFVNPEGATLQLINQSHGFSLE